METENMGNGGQEGLPATNEKAWASLQDTVYFYRSSEWATFAPDTTIPFSVDEVRKMSALKIDWKQYLPGSNKKPELDVQQMKEWLKNKK